MTKIFLDSEFTGLHQKTTLISLGLMSDLGNTFYAEFTDYDKTQVDDCVQKNVINSLVLKNWDVEVDYDPYAQNVTVRGNTKENEQPLSHWLDGFKEIEIWSDCLSYDWVLFNQLFGHAFNLPKNVYYIPFDICTLFKIKGIDPDINREEFCGLSDSKQKHNSLWDAKVIKACYEKLMSDK